jgi:hypothetical protein
MSNAIFRVSDPINDEVRSYLPHSEEIQKLMLTYRKMYAAQVDVPLYIGDKGGCLHQKSVQEGFKMGVKLVRGPIWKRNETGPKSILIQTPFVKTKATLTVNSIQQWNSC